MIGLVSTIDIRPHPLTLLSGNWTDFEDFIKARKELIRERFCSLIKPVTAEKTL